MKSYDAYLFDMDGTLVNSEPLKGKALALACETFGARIDYKIYKDVMGLDWMQVTSHFFKNANISPNIDEFNQEFRKHYQQLLSSELTLNSGAIELLRELQSNGNPCALVSSAARWMIDSITSQLGIEKLFDTIVSKEDVIEHKPAPEAYHLVIKKLGTTPGQSLIFEDSCAGVQAGIASGNDVIAVTHSFNKNHDFTGVIQTITNFRDFKYT
ncbi:HAD family phosphatase [Vibrio sp. S4M6]|uniref:HAD family hydrolase n=1 Tax=Vibrio sinus TaxID=2946865 RepID=UPI00202A9680|nr:HAD family phosphatase [Vibrio sinus]